MEKAYDLKALGDRLEKAGIPLLRKSAEETAKVVYKEFKGWLKDSADISPNPYDNMVVASFGIVDNVVDPLIDKIDGEEG